MWRGKGVCGPYHIPNTLRCMEEGVGGVLPYNLKASRNLEKDEGGIITIYLICLKAQRMAFNFHAHLLNHTSTNSQRGGYNKWQATQCQITREQNNIVHLWTASRVSQWSRSTVYIHTHVNIMLQLSTYVVSTGQYYQAAQWRRVLSMWWDTCHWVVSWRTQNITRELN